MQQPQISIIVPIYNVEKYLDRCIQSLLNQTLTNIEIILVDDESPDNCPAMCDDYAKKDSRIKVIHKKNGGLGYARNSGMEIASGQFVTFIDSDDYVDNNTFQKLFETAQGDNLDTCYYGFTYVLTNGTAYKKPEVEKATFFNGRKDVDSFLLDMIGPEPSYPHDVKFSVSACKAIYSLELIRKNNLKFISEKEIASEDLLFHITYLHIAEHVGVLPDCFYHYCQNSESISHTYSDEKKRRIFKSMITAKSMLAERFPVNQYFIHYQRCLFLSLRGLIGHEVISRESKLTKTKQNIQQIFESKVYDDLFINYPYNQMNFKHKCLYYLLKKKAVCLLIIIFKIIR